MVAIATRFKFIEYKISLEWTCNSTSCTQDCYTYEDHGGIVSDCTVHIIVVIAIHDQYMAMLYVYYCV